MGQNLGQTLYHLNVETTLLVATYIWAEDELKALEAQGFKLTNLIRSRALHRIAPLELTKMARVEI